MGEALVGLGAIAFIGAVFVFTIAWRVVLPAIGLFWLLGWLS